MVSGEAERWALMRGHYADCYTNTRHWVVYHSPTHSVKIIPMTVYRDG